jgi:hypothetical protein
MTKGLLRGFLGSLADLAKRVGKVEFPEEFPLANVNAKATYSLADIYGLHSSKRAPGPPPLQFLLDACWTTGSTAVRWLEFRKVKVPDWLTSVAEKRISASSRPTKVPREPIQPSKTSPNEPGKRRGRRKGSGQTWNWTVIEGWITAELRAEGRLGTKFGWSQSRLVERIQQRCVDKWNDNPSQSLLIEHVQKIEAQQTVGADQN